ncbi:MAG TPA: MFS transporter [Hyphomicrobiaceae bacterium]|nr:MFS transporter [Hyphomicrobiaceae bacterium]
MKDDVSATPSTNRLFLTVFPSIMLPMFLAVVDQTIVATALPAIAATVGGVERLSWVVVAYLVAGTIAAPVYGQLRDVYGGKRMMFVALGIFLVASLLCAVSTSIEMLSAARVLQGLGGGGLMTLSQALIGETIPPRERARYQGYLAGVMVTSSTFGPVVGGLLTHSFGWRSVFLINVPLTLLAVVLTLRLERKPSRGQPWTFDSWGLVLFIGFIVPVLLGLEQAQRMHAGTLPIIIAMMAIGGGALVALILRERRAIYPLLPVHLLRQATIWRSDALAACHGATLVSLVTFLPVYLRVLHGASPSRTGLLLLPLMFGIGTGSMVTGRVVSRTGLTMIFPAVGLVAVTACLILFGFLAGYLSGFRLALFLFVNGLFMGTVMGVVQVTVQNAAGSASLGSAAASVQLSRSIGAAVGTALVGTVLFASVALSDAEATTVFGALVQQGPDTLSGLPPQRQAVILAEVSSAFRNAFLTIAIFAGIGALLAWTIPARRLT